MSTLFNQPIQELIKLRHSVRNYSNTPLSDDLIEQLENYIHTVENPFDQKIRIKLIKKDSYSNELKLGTYGVIKGAQYFLAAACENNDLALMALGYTLEKVILYCTSLGLGTVWLGGTFNKGEFAKAINLEQNEILPIVSPVGYEGGKKSLLASLVGDNSNKRKPYSKLFFNNDFHTALAPHTSDEYLEPLEMLRLAPSAVNKQPWRALKEDRHIHFYLAHTKHLGRIDIGIALCHFHLTTIENQVKGKFTILDEVKTNTDKNFTYVISWID